MGTLALAGIGIVMVYSASSAVALKHFGDSYYFLKKHLLHVLIGLGMLITCRYVPYQVYQRLVYPGLTLSLFLLILLFIPGAGVSAGGARRWLNLFGFSFQPAELAKITLIIYLAYSLNKKREKVKSFTIGLLPHTMVMVLFISLIVLQPDFGMAIIITLIVWAMLFVGGVRLFHLFTGLIVMIPPAYLALIQAGYRIKRIAAFLYPWQYQKDAGYQIVHSLMAFGSGGLLGTGLGNGYQKLFYLPEAHTDFIFSVIGEELGLIGVSSILAVYLLLVLKGTSVSLRAPDLFGTYLAAGLTFALGIQVVVNVGVTLGLLPTKGLTLPLISYGGTSLLMNMMAIGILMNISASIRKARP